MTLATHFLSKNILLVWWLLVLSVAKILSWVQVTPPLTLFRYSLSFCTSRSDKWRKMHQSLLPPVLVLKSVLNFLFCLIGERAKRATIQWQFFVHLWNLDLKCLQFLSYFEVKICILCAKIQIFEFFKKFNFSAKIQIFYFLKLHFSTKNQIF